jgi:hypothetical protein
MAIDIGLSIQPNNSSSVYCSIRGILKPTFPRSRSGLIGVVSDLREQKSSVQSTYHSAPPLPAEDTPTPTLADGRHSAIIEEKPSRCKLNRTIEVHPSQALDVFHWDRVSENHRVIERGG